MTLANAAARILADTAAFSQHVTQVPLYPYQVAPARAVINAVLRRQGLEFLWVMPRQSGKNETAAQVQVQLLNLFQRVGGNIVIGAAGDQLSRAQRRLEERLDNRWNRDLWKRGARPPRVTLNNAAAVFLSTHPGAFSRGETAHILLIIDELQDHDPAHIDAVFTPMRAVHNAPALYLGTVRTKTDALWRKREQLTALQEKDRIQRVFMVSPDQVGDANPAYKTFLSGIVQTKGRYHPTVSAEFFLEPLEAISPMFPAHRQAVIKGEHHRLYRPIPGELYVALIDVGGIDEGAPDGELENPARDYTTLQIYRVTYNPVGQPIFDAVSVSAWQGTSHFATDGQTPPLSEQLLEQLNTWQVAAVAIDASGVGAGLADWLQQHIQHLLRITFSATSKATIGLSWIALMETGRFHWYTHDELDRDAEIWWAQVAACSAIATPGQPLERGLRWGVSPTHRTPFTWGTGLTHDDYLLAASLTAAIDAEIMAGNLKLQTGAPATVIPPFDPLS